MHRDSLRLVVFVWWFVAPWGPRKHASTMARMRTAVSAEGEGYLPSSQMQVVKEWKVTLLFWLERSPMGPVADVRTAIAEGIGVFSAGDLRASSRMHAKWMRVRGRMRRAAWNSMSR